AGVEGWVKKGMMPWERASAVAGAVLMMYSGLLSDVIGILLIMLGLFRQFTGGRGKEKAAGIPA
ncbi:MAG: hypothetical protein ACOY30_04710, partial [Bacillota bacterium]